MSAIIISSWIKFMLPVLSELLPFSSASFSLFFVLESFGLPTFFWGVSSVSIFPFGFGVSGGPDILNIGQLHATAWDHGSQQKRVGHSWDWSTAPGSQGVVSKRFATSSITLAYRSMELKKWGSGWGKTLFEWIISSTILQLNQEESCNLEEI